MTAFFIHAKARGTRVPSPSRGRLGWGWGSEVRGQESGIRKTSSHAEARSARRRGGGEGEKKMLGFAVRSTQPTAFIHRPMNSDKIPNTILLFAIWKDAS